VGLAAAKGITLGLGIPIIGVPSLEGLAGRLSHASDPIRSVIRSRKGEIFTALFQWTPEGSLERLTEDHCVRETELHNDLPEPCIWIGDDYSRQAPMIQKYCGERSRLAPAGFWNRSASSLAAAGLERFRAGRYDDPVNLVPSYYRPPDIRPNPYALPGKGTK
jgi:tRNA threonylcarbamoyladenosine biosynthesis protein TsaB